MSTTEREKQLQEYVSTVATIGFFDGVHLGHRHLIDHVRAEAHRTGMSSLVVTFDNHPRQVLRQDYVPQLLCTAEEKLSRLKAAGVDACALLHFDAALASLSAHDFMAHVLRRQYGVRRLVIGYDNRFGHNRSEGFEDYVAYGRELGIEVIPSQPCTVDDIRVSSSVIRRLLLAGDLAQANRCLGYTYSVKAPVVGGFREGRRLGFRTANMDVDRIGKMLPQSGVYAVKARVGDGPWQPAMTNVGTRPTFGGERLTVETYILDFDADIYDCTLEVAFCRRLRGESRFPDKERLICQLREDEQMIRKLFENGELG